MVGGGILIILIRGHMEVGPGGPWSGAIKGFGRGSSHRLAGFGREIILYAQPSIPRDLTSFYSKDIYQD